MSSMSHDFEFPLVTRTIKIIFFLYESFYSNNLHPTLLLASWWIFCTYFKMIVLNVLPLALLIRLSFKWNNNSSSAISQSHSLHEMMVILEDYLESTMTRYFSWSKGHARTSFIWLVYTYVTWISIQQILSLSTIFILMGSTAIIYKSKWITPIKTTIKTMKYRFTRDNKSNRLWNRLHQQQDQVPYFLFELYENQRLNLFSGQWEGTTLPFERSSWTDSVYYPISSKSQIVLPSFWKWIDDDWSLDESGEWSYGTIIWTKSNQSGSKKWYENKTRSRKWIRRACRDASSRRQSSVFYSQRTAEFPIKEEKKETGDLSSHSKSSTSSTCDLNDEIGSEFTNTTIEENQNNSQIVDEISSSTREEEEEGLEYHPDDSPLKQQYELAPFNVSDTPLCSILKPQHDSLYEKDTKNSNNDEASSINNQSFVTSDDNSSYRKRITTKRLSAGAGVSRDAVWKTIGQQQN